MTANTKTPRVRADFLPFAIPDIGDAEVSKVNECLRTGWVTTGPYTREFEAEFAAAVGARHALAVNSCTAALHLALEGIGIRAGDEVITSTYTFAATAEVIRYFEAVPVLVDVDPRSLNIDPARVAEAITPRTRAIIPVHIAGLPADLDKIYDLARVHKLAVVEDAAHAFPAACRDHRIGSSPGGIRHAACFSFYATKTITTGEGGMICTDDEELANRCRIMSLHGINRDAWRRGTGGGSWYYEIVAPGFKYNLTDIASCLGLVQLERSDAMWRRRCEIAARYNAAFSEVLELEIPFNRSDYQHAWQLYVLRLNLGQLNVDRQEFISELARRNIGASVHFIPLHLHKYYRETLAHPPEKFPNAYREYQRAISLPIYSAMKDEDVEDVIAAVLSIVGEHRHSMGGFSKAI